VSVIIYCNFVSIMYCKLLAGMSPVWEFHQFYDFGAVRYKDEMFRFFRSKVNREGHSETTYGQISTLRDIFSRVSGTHETYHNYLSYYHVI